MDDSFIVSNDDLLDLDNDSLLDELSMTSETEKTFLDEDFGEDNLDEEEKKKFTR